MNGKIVSAHRTPDPASRPPQPVVMYRSPISDLEGHAEFRGMVHAIVGRGYRPQPEMPSNSGERTSITVIEEDGSKTAYANLEELRRRLRL